MFLLYNEKVGENYDRKMMHGVMKVKGWNVSETEIGKVLGEINSEAQRRRQSVDSCSLNSKVYSTKYIGDKIHYDQDEKLEIFGFVHVCLRWIFQ